MPQPELIKSEFEQLIEQQFDGKLYTEMDNKEGNGELLNKYINLFAGDDPIINNIDKDDYESVSEKGGKSFVEPQ